MDEPKPLAVLFEKRMFRVPDYQRGYAWQHDQLKDFWEDLVNLPEHRSHYTGVLTLKEVPASEIPETAEEYWLVEEKAFRVHHIVDGQQRLTTFVIFLQALVEYVKTLPGNESLNPKDIFISGNISLSYLQEQYLYETMQSGAMFRTYKFGYTEDNPSYDYLRHKILKEPGGGSPEETFYTLNLSYALEYFTHQFDSLHDREGMDGLQRIYKKLTKRFLFNEYIIKDEFDVFIAFETMNNRGKKLSDLELLKNRLIYLTTLYSDAEVDPSSRSNLRFKINDAWREVYYQLGRNKTHPLNDDDFLWAHWVMYFKYSRQTSDDYINFLLDDQFSPKKVHQKTEASVNLQTPEEVRGERDTVSKAEENEEEVVDPVARPTSQLAPTDLRDYSDSLKDSAVYWFNSFYPHLAEGMSEEERSWLSRLNRVGIVYFRPLVMAILKNETSESARIKAFKKIERFIFIVFRTTIARANYASSVFYNAARSLDRGEVTIDELIAWLDHRMGYVVGEDGVMKIDEFYTLLSKKFESGTGYYGWFALRYFLFEFESSLLSQSRQPKVAWDNLLKSNGDKISIEHVYPQTESSEWASSFPTATGAEKEHYRGTIGNLLLLSMSINSSLQNDGFDGKKHPRYNANGEKLRNGYSDGSHSEIEVAQNASWGPNEIRDRGMKLLRFMETRWDFRFQDEGDMEKLLFLPVKGNP